MSAPRLDRISLTVRDLVAAEAFYTGALGFVRHTPPSRTDPALARLLDATAMSTMLLRRGAQMLELAAFEPPGAPYPEASRPNDVWFQHCALVTDDIGAAYNQLCQHAFSPISRHGPQRLPGGIVAFKFRDPEGHPLELIQFPQPNPATAGGIDHSAIVVADADRSIGFYTEMLGLRVSSRQVNTGTEQDALDDIDGAVVDVVGLAPAVPAPHVELLGYRAPTGRQTPRLHAADIGATRLVFECPALPPDLEALPMRDSSRVRIVRDPDGHWIVLFER